MDRLLEKGIRFFLLTLLALSLTACTFLGIKTEREVQRKEPVRSTETQTVKVKSSVGGFYQPRINLDQLQSELNFNRSLSFPGYEEKTFNPCLSKSVTNPPELCKVWYMGLVHFELTCRDSTGTVDFVSKASLTPLKRAPLRWKIGKMTGVSKTDFKGRAMIRYASPQSLGYKWIRLYNGTKFLSMRVRSMKKIVVPPDWCS